MLDRVEVGYFVGCKSLWSQIDIETGSVELKVYFTLYYWLFVLRRYLKKEYFVVAMREVVEESPGLVLVFSPARNLKTVNNFSELWGDVSRYPEVFQRVHAEHAQDVIHE